MEFGGEIRGTLLRLVIVLIATPLVFVPVAWRLRRRYGSRALILSGVIAALVVALLWEVRLDAIRAAAGVVAPDGIRIREFLYFLLIAMMAFAGCAVPIERRARRITRDYEGTMPIILGVLGFLGGAVLAGGVLLAQDLMRLLGW